YSTTTGGPPVLRQQPSRLFYDNRRAACSTTEGEAPATTVGLRVENEDVYTWRNSDDPNYHPLAVARLARAGGLCLARPRPDEDRPAGRRQDDPQVQERRQGRDPGRPLPTQGYGL